MTPRTLLSVSLALAVSASLASAARAEPQCTTVAAFNDLVAQQNAFASSVVLTFNVTGVNLDDYTDSKGWMADLVDGSCAGLATAALKVYGTSTNVAHPPGTVKLEHGSACCPAPPCSEQWAEPNPGPPIFTGPSQLCAVKVSVTPTNVGYEIECDGTTYLGDSDNAHKLKVNKIALLSEAGGGHAMTNATASADQVCFELAPQGANTQKLEAIDDVTVSPAAPAVVYAPETDLACGDGDGHVYLKFPVSSPLGKVKSAKLFLRSSADPSADGNGGDLFYVAENGWSEETLTYSQAPAVVQPALGRIENVIEDQWYSVDVTSRVQGKGSYSFALIPRATDQNGAHFLSKEASSAYAPHLLVEYTIVDADGDTHPDGPDCNDADGTVFPGALEQCNGMDDNCDGTVDEGCTAAPDAGPDSGGNDGSGGAAGEGGNTGGGSGSDSILRPADSGSAPADTGCACRLGESRGPAGAGLWVLAGWLASRMRSRSRMRR